MAPLANPPSDPTLATPDWTPTRTAALARLGRFLPRAGRAYADDRNFDLGPEDRSNVSALSPHVRFRLVTEAELIAAAIERHGPRAAEKFVQEVAWRTYWKGWLEQRPGVWTAYRAERDGLIARLDRDPDLRRRYEAVLAGESGIACVDAWTAELIATGYLHNHARMWYASLWSFTLGLPWTLGADFFLRHLLDSDPASNTLSWRWVAGLQTVGKTYAASAENIRRYTAGRFHPTEPFAPFAGPIAGPALPPARPLPRPGLVPKASDGPIGLILTEDDLNPESGPVPEGTPIAAIAGSHAARDRSPGPLGRPALAFAEGALADGLTRASTHFTAPATTLDPAQPDAWRDWIEAHGLRCLVVAEPPIGPARSRLDALELAFTAAGTPLVRLRRPWDDTLWPHATRGFFPFKERLPELLVRLLP